MFSYEAVVAIVTVIVGGILKQFNLNKLKNDVINDYNDCENWGLKG